LVGYPIIPMPEDCGEEAGDGHGALRPLQKATGRILGTLLQLPSLIRLRVGKLAIPELQ
jgi:hypothetical protein